jgi:hypothetical protein
MGYSLDSPDYYSKYVEIVIGMTCYVGTTSAYIF